MNEEESVLKEHQRAIAVVTRLVGRASKAKKRMRKREERRKIVAGAAVLTMVGSDRSLAGEFDSFLQSYVRDATGRSLLRLDEPRTHIARLAEPATSGADGRTTSSPDALTLAPSALLADVLKRGREAADQEERAEKDEHQRKVICGAAILAMATSNSRLATRLDSFLQTFAKRPADRKAFDLDQQPTFLARVVATTQGSDVDAAFEAIASPIRPSAGARETKSSSAAERERNEGAGEAPRPSAARASAHRAANEQASGARVTAASAE